MCSEPSLQQIALLGSGECHWCVSPPTALGTVWFIFGGVSRTIMCLENARVENAGRNCEFTSLVFSPAWADANTAPESVSME